MPSRPLAALLAEGSERAGLRVVALLAEGSGRAGLPATALLAAALLAAGCSNADRPPLPAECTSGPAAVAAALRAAPGEVRLVDGTPLSRCVRRAESDAELQNLGLVLTEVAEDLEAAAPAAPRAALQLGYLIGAARRGAPSESALQAELVHRLERSAAIRMPAASERSLAEGMRAGERGG